MKHFYVCSYGGCGSTLLANSLKQFGEVKHIHSRMPPRQLEYVGDICYSEWFNGIKIPDNQLHEYYVIYIYKNPVKSILSRFININRAAHLNHIQIDPTIKLIDVVKSQTDLYKINEFYKNYTCNNNRNYKIYCIRYEDMFEKQNEISELFGIGNLNLIKKERDIRTEHIDVLNRIYKDLNDKMRSNNWLMIV